jgi:NAD+--asparagine ADP-ribosyltransferase
MAHTFRVRRWTAALAVALLAVGTAAACGDNGSSSSSTSTTESDQVCKDADQLKSAIGDLADVDLSQNGTSSLDSAISKVKDQADALGKSVGDELKPQVDDLKSSLDTLKTAVGKVGEEGGVQSVLDALKGVVKAAGNLTDKATELCSKK